MSSGISHRIGDRASESSAHRARHSSQVYREPGEIFVHLTALGSFGNAIGEVVTGARPDRIQVALIALAKTPSGPIRRKGSPRLPTTVTVLWLPFSIVTAGTTPGMIATCTCGSISCGVSIAGIQ
jgi:hypothetical protein